MLLKKIKLLKARKNHPYVDAAEFRSRDICAIQIPGGHRPITLNDMLERYEKDFPTCDKEFLQFPKRPFYYEKSFQNNPVRRAVDIENKKLNLKEKVDIINLIPFDFENDQDESIKQKTVDKILESVKRLVNDMAIKTNECVRSHSNVLNEKVTGKLEDLKDPKKTLATINEIQVFLFDKVIDSEKTLKKGKKKRVIDIEERKQNLKEKLSVIDSIPFNLDIDSDENIKQKTFDKILESIEKLMMIEGLLYLLKVKVAGNLKDLKDPTRSIVRIMKSKPLFLKKLSTMTKLTKKKLASMKGG